MGPLLLLRSFRDLGLLKSLLPCSTRGLIAVYCICSSAACSTSTSKPSSGPEALRQQQQQQQQQDVWERRFQRRIVRRRPKGLLNPYAAAAAAAAQHMPDAQRIANTVWHTNSSSIGMASLKQSVPHSYFNSSSSSSDQHTSPSQATGSQQRQQLRQTAVSSIEPSPPWANAAAVSDAAEEAAAEAAAAAAIADAADVVSPTQTAAAASGAAGMRPDFRASQHPAGNLPPLEFEVVPRRSQHNSYAAQQLQQQYPGGSSSSNGEMLTVVAVHVGGEVDFQAFCKEFNFKDRVTTLRDHVLLEVDELNEEKVLFGPGREEQRDEKKLMVIFRYGSVIFFNLRQRSRDAWLDKLTPFIKVPEHYRSNGGSSSSNGGIGPQRRTDETSVVIRSTLDEQQWACLEPDKIVVRALDVGNVRTISHVLGQSVALDYYNSKVDEAIQNFSPYLKEVAESGTAHRIKEKQLLQHIADNSLLYTDVVTKIGLLDISQTVWQQDKYCKLWEALRSDYEIEKRFDAINRKLGPMLENAKFLLDIRAEKKSAEAEWIIIGLICLEVVVNCYGHFML